MSPMRLAPAIVAMCAALTARAEYEACVGCYMYGDPVFIQADSRTLQRPSWHTGATGQVVAARSEIRPDQILASYENVARLYRQAAEAAGPESHAAPSWAIVLAWEELGDLRVALREARAYWAHLSLALGEEAACERAARQVWETFLLRPDRAADYLRELATTYPRAKWAPVTLGLAVLVANEGSGGPGDREPRAVQLAVLRNAMGHGGQAMDCLFLFRIGTIEAGSNRYAEAAAAFLQGAKLSPEPSAALYCAAVCKATLAQQGGSSDDLKEEVKGILRRVVELNDPVYAAKAREALRRVH